MEVERQLRRLLDLLDSDDQSTTGTSIRLPVTLRDATTVAVELGVAASTTELAVRGLRAVLDGFAQRAVLDAHYGAHPTARPDLAEIALAAAEIDGNPLAGRPDLIRRAAERIGAVKDDPTPDDVLVYAAGLSSAVA